MSGPGQTAADLLALCKDALQVAGEPAAEICARTKDRGCARFAVGELGEHMILTEPFVAVRVARGSRVAEITTSVLDRSAIVSAVRRAADAARFVPETAGFPGFAGHEGPETSLPARFAEATANATAEDRVVRLAPVLDAVRDAGLVSAGMLETSQNRLAVATTSGCERAHDSTIASFRVWALETPGAGGAAGYGGQMHRDLQSLDLERETARAIRIARMSKNPKAIEAGTYDVVMEPAAVAELLEWLASITFGAPEVEQGTSAVAGRAGERITGETVAIDEDPLDASDLGFGTPFDREGVPRRYVSLIDRGLAREVLFDRICAARMRARSTGSSQLAGYGESGGVGPCAIHLGAGEAESVDELISGMKRGLYICRLHYVNGFLEPRRAVMTGLTRDGCFFVENGKIAGPVGNLRFTDSFLEALARSDGMTRARSAIPTWWSDAGATVTPAVRMRGLRFNGRSQEPPRLT